MNEGIDLQKRPLEIEIVLSHKRKNQPFIEEVLALSASIQRIIIFYFFPLLFLTDLARIYPLPSLIAIA